MAKIALAILLMTVPFAGDLHAQSRRMAAGIIYFTNNTPRDLRSFPVEILSQDRKKIVAVTRPDEHYRFAFKTLKPGKYLLRLTWPNQCVLWYRLDLRKESRTEIKIIMDAACAHENGVVRDLPIN